ncbi:MAG: glutathione S-transferase family protein, partial [Burkholderiales bacterium]|nr:glutathione S-transferase family protein [Burkholderiales bacterium]
MNENLTLISHQLCPYVQRAAIVMHEKGIPFRRIDIDLAQKPDWFLRISPLGKTPVLLANEQSVFESAVICEYLDETRLPRMHPQDALLRAQHRAWMEFGSAILNLIGQFYSARDATALAERASDIHQKFEQLEVILGDGPYFEAEKFSMVDAVFAPVFRYFDVFERIGDFGFFEGLPKVLAWRSALSTRGSVKRAVSEDYPDLLMGFLRQRKS